MKSFVERHGDGGLMLAVLIADLVAIFKEFKPATAREEPNLNTFIWIRESSVNFLLRTYSLFTKRYMVAYLGSGTNS